MTHPKMLVLCGGLLLLSFAACMRDGAPAARTARPMIDPSTSVVFGKTIDASPDLTAEGASTVLILVTEKKAGHRRLTGTCTGSIISPDLVVTAGHCVVMDGSATEAVSASSVLVHLGRWADGESMNDARTLAVADLRLADGFTTLGADNLVDPRDIALLKLATPLKLGYRPARLLPKSHELQVGDPVLVAGYGNPHFSGDFSTYHLRSFSYLYEGESRGSTLVFLKPSRLGGISDGDSGGPVFAEIDGQPYVFGTASTSDDGERAISHYEDFRKYSAWLENQARAMGTRFAYPK